AVLIALLIGISFIFFCGKNDRDRVKRKNDLKLSQREEQKSLENKANDGSQKDGEKSKKESKIEKKSEKETSSKRKSRSKSKSKPTTGRSAKSPRPKESKSERSKKLKGIQYNIPDDSNAGNLDKPGHTSKGKKAKSSVRRRKLQSIDKGDKEKSKPQVDTTQSSARSGRSDKSKKKSKSINGSLKRKKGNSLRSKSQALTPMDNTPNNGGNDWAKSSMKSKKSIRKEKTKSIFDDSSKGKKNLEGKDGIQKRLNKKKSNSVRESVGHLCLTHTVFFFRNEIPEVRGRQWVVRRKRLLREMKERRYKWEMKMELGKILLRKI
ncbi:hypothetical protein PENTCL1PPCAC_26823, partial [Pristionchus entomophagus]